MRLVIAITAIAFFLIWDGLYNQGHFIDAGVRSAKHAVAYVTG